MSKARQAQRKKARKQRQSRRAHANGFVFEYEGYMKMFMDDDTLEGLIWRTEFDGEWIDKAGKIFSEDHKYRLGLHIISADGQRAHGIGELDGKYDEVGLVNAMKIAFDRFVESERKDWPELEIDLRNSYVVVRA